MNTMTWTQTIPDPTAYYHAPRKLLGHMSERSAPPGVLQLWIPRRRHPYGDPYHEGQRGHLTRITLTERTEHGVTTSYDLHQRGDKTTGTTMDKNGERPMTPADRDHLASITRQALTDYDQPTATLGKTIEKITHYRQRAQQRLGKELNSLIRSYDP